ncbi:MAG: redox-sensing transcriptional repressor Rex [Oscillospiraceae bacterium]|nr:redox-sensing transcriptional repressor Rex [Oscillospiraceae bacterium]
MPGKLKKSVSMSVIRRLPRYYRFTGELIEQGIVRISSGELAKRMAVTASQIRQDLNCFGGFGQQGYGYNLVELREEIGKILGVDQSYKTVLIGAGNLGAAIAAGMNFKKYGCELIGVFDSDPNKHGKKVAGFKIQGLEALGEFCKREAPDMAVLCTPKSAVHELADALISYGVKAFWNFGHYDLSLTHKDILVENVHLGDSIMTLTYEIRNN